MSTSSPAIAPGLGRHAVSRLRLDASVAAFAGLLALGAALVLVETRGLSFFFDDWEFILHRRGLAPSVLLRPHGPHLSLVPILIYKVLLKLFGASSYLPFRMLAAFDLVVLALVLGVVCRERWGEWWGLAPVLLLVTLGPGAISLLWSFQSGYAIADSAGLVALIALARGGRHAGAVACVALITSLASASQGLGFLAGAAVLVAVRGDLRRQAWVVAVPAILYALWYLKYGQQASETQLSLWNISLVYALQALSSTISGVLGVSSPGSQLPPQLDPTYGQPLALAAIAAVVIGLWRGWRPPPLFWGALTTLVVLWIAASLSNIGLIRRPTDSRYLPTNVMLLMICLCTAVPRPRLRATGTIAAIVALAIVSATNASQFGGMRRQMKTSDIASRAELGALLILRGHVPPQFSPAPPFLPGLINDVQAGPFFSAVDSFGMIADSPAMLLRLDESTRELADQVLQRGLAIGFSPEPTAGAPAGVVPAVVSGAARASRGCLVLGSSAPLVIRAAAGTLELTAAARVPLAVALARFAAAYDVSIGQIPRGRMATIRIPADRAPQVPWRMLIVGAGGRVCALAT